MTALLRWMISLLVTVAAILFAVANRHLVPVNWSPFDPSITVPVFMPVLVGVAFGFVLGAFMVWLNSSDLRRERRRQKRLIHKLEHDLRKDDEIIIKHEPAPTTNAAPLSIERKPLL